jgi:predicted ester cyclase
MSSETNKKFIQEYLDALRTDKSPATLDKYINDEHLVQHIEMFESALPGYWIEAEDLIAEGDRVAMRGTVHGVHNGSLMGIPPTGKAIHISGFLIYRIADNKIVEHWMLADMPALLQQIGAMPVQSHA